MAACASIPTVDEPVDRFDRRLGAGTGPLGGGPPGSALRGISVVGGQSGPRRGSVRTAIQSLQCQSKDTSPTVQRGSSRSSARRTRSEVAQPAAASVSHTSSGAPPRSSPEVSTSAEAAPSSGTEITRRLLMEETRVLSRPDCHREVTSAPRDSLRFERGG